MFHLVPSLSTAFRLFRTIMSVVLCVCWCSDGRSVWLSGRGPSIFQTEVGGWVGGIFLKLTSREHQRNVTSMTQGLGCVMTETVLGKCALMKEKINNRSLSQVTLRTTLIWCISFVQCGICSKCINGGYINISHVFAQDCACFLKRKQKSRVE